MDLIVVATPQEIQPFLDKQGRTAGFLTLVTGPGCVESALHLARFLAASPRPAVSRVINVGVAGAYRDTGVELLDICLAEHEILADFGIASGDRLEALTFPGVPDTCLTFDQPLVNACAAKLLATHNIPKRGRFLTVNSVSGTWQRGGYLRDKHQAICENMEGFAVARVCQSFLLPHLELRTVSNFVEDRNLNGWQMAEACALLAEALPAVIDYS